MHPIIFTSAKVNKAEPPDKKNDKGLGKFEQTLEAKHSSNDSVKVSIPQRIAAINQVLQGHPELYNALKQSRLGTGVRSGKDPDEETPWKDEWKDWLLN